jgi:hypothetical protein
MSSFRATTRTNAASDGNGIDPAASFFEQRGSDGIGVEGAVLHAHSFPSAPLSRRDTQQHPVHFKAVCEFDHHLIDKLVAADGSGHRDHLHVGRHFRDKMRGVELAQLGLAAATGQHGDVIDVGVLDRILRRL